MPHRSLFVVILASASPLFADDPPLVAPEGPRSPAEQQKMFHLPPGFEITLVAAEPQIRKPMNMAFDHRGRLVVTQSVEYPFPAKEGMAPRDTVQIFEDTNGDGVPDKPHTFADGLNIPIGVCPLGDNAMVYSIPEIRYFDQLDQAGKATRRTPLFSGFGFRDTHGMASSFTRWIDGWVYACHGFANDSAVHGKTESLVKMNSGNTYRMRPDGSRIEQWTWGQVNPFGMCFDSLGNQFTADCHSKPIYNVLRGAYYPSFEKPHDGLGFGPSMMEHLHGSTGIAGVVVYEAEGFPAEYRGNTFIGNPVTGRINRDRLETTGSTFKAIEQPDFLWCDDLWFRPVDIKLAPDGSLYIADFYNCMIGHYEVPLTHPRRDRERGRIWRISHKSMTSNQKAGDFAAMSVEQLVQRLGDVNLMVRVGATNELADRNDPSSKPMLNEALKSASPVMRAHAMWALGRIGGLAPSTLLQLAQDADRLVRVHAIKLIAEHEKLGDAELSLLPRALDDQDAFVRRAAADAIGRHPTLAQIPLLLASLRKASGDDAALVHTLRMALRDHLKTFQDAFGRDFAGPDFSRIADVALGVHSAPSGDFMVRYLAKSDDRSRIPEMVNHAIRHCDASRLAEALEIVARLEWRLAPWADQNAAARAAFNGFAQRGAPQPPRLNEWISRLAGAQLGAGDGRIVADGLELVRDLKVASAFDAVAALSTPGSKFKDQRSLALDAATAANADKAIPVLKTVLDEPKEPTELRRRAAENLGSLVHMTAARAALAAQLPHASQELAGVIARGMSRNAQAAKDLAALLDERKVSVLLARDPEVHNNLSRAKLHDYGKRRAAWLKDAPSEDATLAKLLDERRKWAIAANADLKAGEAVFTKHCGVCHQIENKGAKIGPQLDGVGVRDVDRLLEDLLAPSRNVDQAFRSTQLLMRDGRSVSGLLLREEGAVLVMADSQGKEQRIEKAAVEERRLSPVSPMPADVGTRLTPSELRDLIAFLRLPRTQAKK